MHLLNNEISFPDPSTADADGLVAIGGDLSVERLLLAYKMGIFPWYNEDEPILWWSPDPRCVLFPDKLKISKSMKPVINKGEFRFTMNRAFKEVVTLCKTINRKEEQGTWINSDIVEAYVQLHEKGFALSAETWFEGKLVGGLYGVIIGKVFYGESMFSVMPNASKFAFIQLVQKLKKEGLQLIDCQIKSEHLMSLGAELLSRKTFNDLLSQCNQA
jgi:leucyl/phenylalanyl-tRNA--protein transferase